MWIALLQLYTYNVFPLIVIPNHTKGSDFYKILLPTTKESVSVNTSKWVSRN